MLFAGQMTALVLSSLDKNSSRSAIDGTALSQGEPHPQPLEAQLALLGRGAHTLAATARAKGWPDTYQLDMQKGPGGGVAQPWNSALWGPWC